MEYNKYKIDYPAIFVLNGLKNCVYVESVLSVKAFPIEIKKCKSIIYDYLNEKGFDKEIEQYNLLPFDIKVQTVLRTFIDKVFALCDYYIDGRILGHSRHIYDIHKLFPLVDLSEDIKGLIQEIREWRKSNRFCYSAADDVNINEILKKIIAEETYKSDYNDLTEILLYEKVGYDEAIQTLQKVLELNLF